MKLIKPKERQSAAIITILFLLLIAFAGSLYAQSRTHDLGDFKLRVDAFEFLDTNQDPPTGAWPQDVYRYDNIVFYTSGFSILKFIDDQNQENNKYTAMYVVDYNQTEPYGIKEYRRYEPPEVWVYSEGSLQQSSRRFNGTVVPDLVADQVIEKRYKKCYKIFRSNPVKKFINNRNTFGVSAVIGVILMIAIIIRVF